MMVASGWTDAQALFRRYAVLIAVVGGSAAVLPYGIQEAGFAPPWPRATIELAAIVQVILALIALLTTNARMVGATKRKVLVSSVAFICLVLAYSWAYSELVFLGGPAKEPLIKGLACTTDALRLYANDCPLLSGPILDKGEEVEQFWTPSSITQARVLLQAAWLLMFAALGYTLSVFIAFLSMRKSRFIDVTKDDRLPSADEAKDKELR